MRVLPATSRHQAYLHHLDPAGFLRENRPWSDLPWLCQVANSLCLPSSCWWCFFWSGTGVVRTFIVTPLSEISYRSRFHARNAYRTLMDLTLMSPSVL